jgi:hypothetical protein
VSVTTTTTDGGTVTKSDATTENGSSSASTTVPVANPTPVVVDLSLLANFGCPVEGVFHATLTTSVGGFTNGLPPVTASTPAKVTDAATSPSAAVTGVTGASVTVLLTTGKPDARYAPDSGVLYTNPLTGEVALQLVTDRAAQVQAVVGDTSQCWNVAFGALTDSGTELPGIGLPTITACEVQTAPAKDASLAD